MKVVDTLAKNIPLGKIIAAHVITNTDPMQFQKQLDEFCKTKEVQNIVINTSVVPTGMQLLGGKPNMQMTVIISAYIQWFCTQEEYDSFLFQQKTLIAK